MPNFPTAPRFNLLVAGLLVLASTPVLAEETNLIEPDLIEAARDTLAGIQENSFAADREYCGMLGRNAQGNIVVTRPRKGREDSCMPNSFYSESVDTLASFHTHGSHHLQADAEVPSSDDFLADEEEGVIGFVSTPGGRFWIIEPELNQVRQICGPGCLPKDPDYEPVSEGKVRNVYTLEQLLDREAGLDD
ncbi:MAG: DUF4329 domain-containing protein [Pseudomonadota bacterium]